jgi:uracil-DNA glycosylase
VIGFTLSSEELGPRELVRLAARAEAAVVEPELLVALGAVAARSLYGSTVKVARDRGSFVDSDLAPSATVTVHPSSLFRIDDPEERRLAHAEFERDLAAGWARLDGGGS